MNLRRFLRLTEDGLATIMDFTAKPASPSQSALAVRLSADLQTLVSAGKTGDGSPFWQGICQELCRLAVEDDPMRFMRWPAVGATMVHGAAPITFQEWWILRRTPDWHSVWKPALRHPQLGGPPPFPLMLSTNAMAIEHAFHLFQFHAQQGTYLHEADCIIEFGGGFGSMCRLARALGFRGRYIIFDLPHVLALQRYYLGLHGIEADGSGDAGVWLCPDLDRIMAWLDHGDASRISLISTWALSEMPLAVRQRIEPFFRFSGVSKALLAYQPAFEGNDNRAYFRELTARTADRWSWIEAPVDPADKTPSPQDSLYIFGTAQ